MRVGLQVPNFTWPSEQGPLGETVARIAERAEQAGFSSFWLMDHFFQIEFVGPPELEMLESWSTLAFVAARTKSLKLGTMVTGVTYRHPGILIKTATTLDVLSGGRAYLGIGAAWYEGEHQGLGVAFPPLAERFERLEETLQIAHQMWAGNERPYIGRHYHLARPLNSPRSVQQPHPPILIGGGGERKTLRLVAQYADACNLFARQGPDGLAHKLAVLREHCQALGRPYEAIEKTTLDVLSVTSDGRDGSFTPEAAIAYFRGLAKLGIDIAIFSMPNANEIEPFDLLATKVIPAVAQPEVAGR